MLIEYTKVCKGSEYAMKIQLLFNFLAFVLESMSFF